MSFFTICIQTENYYYFISDQHVVMVMRQVHADKQGWTVCSSLPAPRASPQLMYWQVTCFEAFPCIHSFAWATHVMRTQSRWNIGKNVSFNIDTSRGMALLFEKQQLHGGFGVTSIAMIKHRELFDEVTKPCRWWEYMNSTGTLPYLLLFKLCLNHSS